MDRKQLIALFICNLVPFFVGNTLLPLLPVYVRQLGADPASTGIYLSLAFASLAVGTLFAGWLSSRYQIRKLLVILGAIIGLPSMLLMGVAQDLAQLTVITMIVWFTGGAATSIVNILTGLFAEPAQRGRTFGIIGLTFGLGQLLAGLITGPMVDRWGFAVLFIIAALSQPVQLLAGLALRDRPGASRSRSPAPTTGAWMTTGFIMLLVAHILANGISNGANLGRPLRMDELGLSASAITSTVIASGLFTLPLPFLVGWLSDQLGRKPLLIVCYLGPSLGMFLLAAATELWHFWLSVIITFIMGSSAIVGSAMVTDLVPFESLDNALARFGAARWVGAVIGFTAFGFVIQRLGLLPTFVIAGTVPLISVLLILLIRPAKQPAITAHEMIRLE